MIRALTGAPGALGALGAPGAPRALGALGALAMSCAIGLAFAAPVSASAATPPLAAATPAASGGAAAGARAGGSAQRIDWVGNGGAGGGSVGDRSVSYSTWSLSGDIFIVRYLLPSSDAERLAGSDIEVLVQQRVGDYLLSRLAVRADGRDCPAIDQGYDIGRVDPLTVASGLYGFEIFFQCPPPPPPQPALMALTPTQLAPPPPLDLVLENRAQFGRIPGHVDFARLQMGDYSSEQLFTRHHQQLALRIPGVVIRSVLPVSAVVGTARSARVPSAGVSRYAALGFDDVLGSADRLCFLVGALLLLGSVPGQRPGTGRPGTGRPATRRAWLEAATYLLAGLAAGYALSLIAALALGLAPRERLLDAAIGGLVVLLAAQFVCQSRAQPRRLAAAATVVLLCLAVLVWIAHARWPVLLLAGAGVFAGSYLAAAEQLQTRPLGWLLVPALFGFLDGFVLPAEVVPMQLPSRVVLPMAAGFDVGALLAEIVVLAVLGLTVAAVAAWLRRRARAGASLAADLVTAGLSCAGLFWMLSRLHG